MQIKDGTKKEILDIIFKHISQDTCSVLLFGSYAQSKARQSSDIDIGVVSVNNLSFDDILAIKEELNEQVNTLKDIDIVDFSAENIDKDFKRIALEDFEIWHQTKESLEILNNIINP